MNSPYELQAVLHVYERTPAPEGAVGGTWRYTLVSANNHSYFGGDTLRTLYPPAVGDRIRLGGDGKIGCYTVIARQWDYPMRGSGIWRPMRDMPDQGPTLWLIVERAKPEEELFADEADLTEEEENA